MSEPMTKEQKQMLIKAWEDTAGGSLDACVFYKLLKSSIENAGYDTSPFEAVMFADKPVSEQEYDKVVKNCYKKIPEVERSMGISLYIDRAKKILMENIKIQKEEEAIKIKRAELDKKEREFIDELEDQGIQSLTMTDGITLSVKTTWHCSINKNMADKANVADWLEDHGGESLVHSTLMVDGTKKADLKVMEIPFVESVEMNTTKVKALVTEMLGLKDGTVASIELKDLPKGLHFFGEKEIRFE